MRKRIFVIALLFASFQFNGMAQLVVHDPEAAAQDAMEFLTEIEEMIQQGYDQAEQLYIQGEERSEKITKVKEEIEDIANLAKKVVVLYREIANCSTKLENIRKKLVASKYLSTDEKYTIYKSAQKIVESIIEKRSDIEKIVKKCQTYNRNESAKQKEETLNELISMVRNTASNLEEIEKVSKDIIGQKRTIIENEYQLRSCFSVKLY